MWFIQYILIWYLIFYLSKKLSNNLLSSLFLLFAGLVFLFIFKDSTWGEQSFSFVIGVVFSQFKAFRFFFSSKSPLLLSTILFLGIIFSGLFLYVKILGLDTVNNYLMINIIQMFMKVTIAIFVIQLTYCYKNYLYPGVILVGVYSYEIYLAHTLIIDMIKNNNHYYVLIAFFILFIFISVVIKKVSILINSVIFEKTSKSITL